MGVAFVCRWMGWPSRRLRNFTQNRIMASTSFSLFDMTNCTRFFSLFCTIISPLSVHRFISHLVCSCGDCILYFFALIWLPFSAQLMLVVRHFSQPLFLPFPCKHFLFLRYLLLPCSCFPMRRRENSIAKGMQEGPRASAVRRGREQNGRFSSIKKAEQQ